MSEGSTIRMVIERISNLLKAPLEIDVEQHVSSILAKSGSTLNQNGSKYPQDLMDLWDISSRTALYEDILYGQWGIVIHDLKWCLFETELVNDLYPDEFTKSDLIIGEFLGDQEKLLISLEKDRFGQVSVFQPLSVRHEWPIVADRLSEFLMRFLDFGGQKYWE